MNLTDISYSGTAKTRWGNFRYRRAKLSDVPELASLYASCAVNRENYRYRLEPGDPRAFDCAGGMFVVMGEDEIRREVRSCHSLWAVFTDDRERIAGSFWFADHNEDIPPAFRQDKTAYPREIVVPEEYKGKLIGRMLYYTIFCELQRCGFARSVCDVYRLCAYEAGGIRACVDLLNRPSYINMLLMGGRYEGAAPQKEIELDGLKVWIEPQIFSFCHGKTLDMKNELFDPCGIQIVRAQHGTYRTDGTN